MLNHYFMLMIGRVAHPGLTLKRPPKIPKANADNAGILDPSDPSDLDDDETFAAGF